MKKIVIVFLLVLVVGLGVTALVQRSQLAQAQAQLADTLRQLKTVEEQLAQKTESDEKIALAETKAKVLLETLQETTAASVRQSQQVSQLEQSLAAAQTNTGPDLGKLLKDPDMREMIKAQQKAFMGPMIDKNYGELFKQLNLTPEQSAHLKELLEKKMLAAADAGMSMLDGSMDAEKRKELVAKMKAETDAFTAEIKEYLGEENSKQFDQYEKSLPDRMVVNQFRDQLASSGLALDPTQEKQLMQALQEERTNFKWTMDYSNKDVANGNPQEMFNSDRLAQYAKEKERMDQQFLERARATLMPEQLAALEKFLASQRAMQDMAMKMAGQMFKPAK